MQRFSRFSQVRYLFRVAVVFECCPMLRFLRPQRAIGQHRASAAPRQPAYAGCSVPWELSSRHSSAQPPPPSISPSSLRFRCLSAQQQPVIASMLDHPSNGLHWPLLQARQRPILDPVGQPQPPEIAGLVASTPNRSKFIYLRDGPLTAHRSTLTARRLPIGPPNHEAVTAYD